MENSETLLILLSVDSFMVFLLIHLSFLAQGGLMALNFFLIRVSELAFTLVIHFLVVTPTLAMPP